MTELVTRFVPLCPQLLIYSLSIYSANTYTPGPRLDVGDTAVKVIDIVPSILKSAASGEEIYRFIEI